VNRLDAFFGRDGDADHHDWREVARWLTAAHQGLPSNRPGNTLLADSAGDLDLFP
jgi:hypothetical protein